MTTVTQEGSHVSPIKRKVDYPETFNRFWSSYPKRKGSNPKYPAFRWFDVYVRRGTDVEAIIDGASNYAVECDRLNLTQTEFVAMAMTWLMQRRWEDYAWGAE